MELPSAETLRVEIAEATRRVDELTNRQERLSVRGRLARLLRDLADQDADCSHIESALEVYRASLEDTSPDDGDALWRETNAEFGTAYLELFRARGTLEHARRALRPLKNALPLHSPGTRRHRALSRSIGEAFLALGQEGGDPALLKQAVQAYRLALGSEDAADYDATERVRALRDLAAALRALGALSGDPDLLREALGQVETALAMVESDEPFSRLLLVGEARRIRETMARHGAGSAPAREALNAYADSQRLVH